ncbi:RHS repeat-associated core domain-containing protein [Kitasatospora griseola]|uniref:RHS repeat-associated core domain-containing protein n=1 Tax=Kitasatospora griseola TaxID=2064 RepID=UPI00364BD424
MRSSSLHTGGRLRKVAGVVSLMLIAETGLAALSTGQAFSASPSVVTLASGAPGTPSGWGLTTWSVNPYSGIRYTANATPTLWANAVNANGSTYQAQFEISAEPTAADTTYTYTGSSGTTASGVNALLVVPTANALPNGKHLRVRSRAFNGADYSAWTDYTTFTVDTTQPVAPTVSCNGFPQNSWNAAPNGAITCTFSTTSADGAGYDWGLDDLNTPNRLRDTTTGTGGASLQVSITPDQGWHMLSVRTVNVAGNLSANTVSYGFGIGADGVGLLAPADGSRSARRIMLSAKGRTDYTGATYEYRFGEADAWKQVPAADVIRVSTGSAVTWPVQVTGGSPADLSWNVTSSLAQDGPIEVRAKFTGSASTGYSDSSSVTVDRNAGPAPDQAIGPGNLNPLTGDYSITSTDASFFGLSVTRTASSRRPTAGAQQTGQAAIFGPQWSSGTLAQETDSSWRYVEQTSPTAVSVVDSSGARTGFTAAANGSWTPEPGAEKLTLTGQPTGSFTLTDTDGRSTVFAKASGATVWNAATTSLPTAASTSTVVSETVTASGSTFVRPKYLIGATSAVSAATCSATPSTAGCRVLELVYANSTTATASAFGDYSGQVSTINLWSTVPGAGTATAVAVSKYAYDASGFLRESWDPRISTPLKTAYTYDSAGRVVSLTPPGELAWTFSYGQAGGAATSGDGMLLSVSRPTLVQGSADQTAGTATTNVVYGVPLSGSAAPYRMGAQDVAAWGQRDIPTDATAIFPPDQVPASHNGSALGAGSYTRASISYIDASGLGVNSALPGGAISTTQHDRFGNTIRSLTAANRSLALGLTNADQAALGELGIAQLATDDRAELLTTFALYNASGTRLLEQFGPLRRVELTSDFKSGDKVLFPTGTVVSANSWSINEYDSDRPTDGTATVSDKLTLTISGLRVLGLDSIIADRRITRTEYDWAKGMPTLSVKDSGGLNLITGTGYNAQGKVTAINLPGSTGDDAASRTTVYWSGSGTGWCKGRPEWADMVCWTGPSGSITGGGSNPTELVDSLFSYDRYGQATEIAETSGSGYRTTALGYDAAGRQTTTTVTGNVGQAIPSVTTGYDSATGRPVTTSSSTGGTITRRYDKLGRPISYTDADGGTSSSTFDDLNRPVTITDSAPSTTTYTYDTSVEPTGVATKIVDSVAGTFTALFNADGAITKETLPGGYTLTQALDATGSATNRTYTRDSDGAVLLADSVTRSIHGEVATHSAATGGATSQKYSYDRAGRLTEVRDTVNSVCTQRTYTLDKRSNRVAQTAATGGTDGTCPTSGPTTVHNYDTGDRLVDSGYVYDTLGRTTALPGSTVGYYTNDRAYQLTTGSQRQTWALDSGFRFRSWTTETNTSGTWSRTGSKVNHYSGDIDSPRWINEDANGTITRNVADLTGDLAATTGKTGSTVLQLTNVHGDVAVQLPLATPTAPTVLDYDEFGNPRAGQTGTRYGWLGGKARSAETAAGLTLMGARLYNSATGRFLSVDPVPGGSANSYEYANQDPVNRFDLDGQKVSCGMPSCDWRAPTPWYRLYDYWDTTRWYPSTYNSLPKYMKAFLQSLQGVFMTGCYVEGTAWRYRYRKTLYKRYVGYSVQYWSKDLGRMESQSRITVWVNFFGSFSKTSYWDDGRYSQ